MKSMERKNWSIGRFGSRLLSLLSREKSPFLFNCENNCKQHRAHNTESKSENKFSHTCSRTSHVAVHVDRCNDEDGQTSWIFVRSSYSASSLVLLSDLHRIFCKWERINEFWEKNSSIQFINKRYSNLFPQFILPKDFPLWPKLSKGKKTRYRAAIQF